MKLSEQISQDITEAMKARDPAAALARCAWSRRR